MFKVYALTEALYWEVTAETLCFTCIFNVVLDRGIPEDRKSIFSNLSQYSIVYARAFNHEFPFRPVYNL